MSRCRHSARCLGLVAKQRPLHPQTWRWRQTSVAPGVLPSPPDEIACTPLPSGARLLAAGFARVQKRRSAVPPGLVTSPRDFTRSDRVWGRTPPVRQARLDGPLHWRPVPRPGAGHTGSQARRARRPGHSWTSATEKRHPQPPSVRQRVLVCRGLYGAAARAGAAARLPQPRPVSRSRPGQSVPCRTLALSSSAALHGP